MIGSTHSRQGAGLVQLPHALVIGGLLAILGVEVAVLWPVTREFFTGDCIYYIARPLESWADVVSILTRLDDVRNFRPLTYVVATPQVWLFGLDPFPYHVTAIVVHAVMTVLAFWLAALVLRSRVGGLIAAAWFGWHSTAAQVGFGLTFVPDHCYAVPFVFAIIALIKSEQSSGRTRTAWFAASTAAFVLALLSKEPAVMFPAAATLVVLLGIAQRAPGALAWRAAFQRTAPFWIIVIVYVGWYVWLGRGYVMPTDESHPYFANIGLATVTSKFQYFEWSVNIKDVRATTEAIAEMLPASVAAESSSIWIYLAGPLYLLWQSYGGSLSEVVSALRLTIETPTLIAAIVIVTLGIAGAMRAGNRLVWFGILFWVCVLVPVLPLPPHKTMGHNLYVPLVGFGIAVAGWMLQVWSRPAGSPRRWIAVAAVAVLLISGARNMRWGTAMAWPTTSSRITRTFLEDVNRAQPQLPPGATLHLLGDENATVFPTAGGYLFRVFYNDRTVRTTYGSASDQSAAPADAFVFRLEGGHLAPVRAR